ASEEVPRPLDRVGARVPRGHREPTSRPASGAGVPRPGRRQALLRVRDERAQGAKPARQPRRRGHRRSVLGRGVEPEGRHGAGDRGADREGSAVPPYPQGAVREVSAVSGAGRDRRVGFRRRRGDADERLLLGARVGPQTGASTTAASGGSPPANAAPAPPPPLATGTRPLAATVAGSPPKLTRTRRLSGPATHS